ncbi:MAG: hypothetical protein ACI822_003224 [Gammaproteobacteria bacterium]|jgi:hypothetical protein
MTENRTWLASVLFLDIVGYSRVPVDQQLAFKAHFKSIVAPGLTRLNMEECIQLDTGDGCAICYLGDPESLYPIAIQLQQQFSSLDPDASDYYQVRLGLNLGPIKITDGIGGDRNCVGSGINDAQRVMDFAAENQLLISRSFFEMVNSMSSAYSDQLRAAGSRSDKHDKIHDVYELVAPASNAVSTSTMAPTIATNPSALSLEAEVENKIISEYARYLGKDQAQQVFARHIQQAHSLASLCSALGGELSEDDRYQFGVFTQYYGYSGY